MNMIARDKVSTFKGCVYSHSLKDTRRIFNRVQSFFGTSHLNKKLKMINERALKYHKDYIRSLDLLEGKNRSMMQELFPHKKGEIQDLFFRREENTELEEDLNCKEDFLLPAEDIKNTYQKEMKCLDLIPFGSIRIIHNDILEEAGDCLVVPMVPNFLPMSGFGAFILQKGGKELVKEIVVSIKQLIKRRLDILYEYKEEYLKENKENGPNEFKQLLQNTKSLQIGDTILTKPHNVSSKIRLLVFLIMPYYWQGNCFVSSNKLRFAISNCLKQLNDLSISSILIPNIASGIFGYEPRESSSILVESSIELMLQLNETIPTYNVNNISFVDSDFSTCKYFCESLEENARNFLPKEQVITAAQYWNSVNRRLLEIPSNVVYFCRRENKISFKKYHGIIRRKIEHYYSNIRPYKWRASRVLDPPTFLLYKRSGEPSSYQFKPNPYYYKNITHTLYPIMKKGLVNLRIGKRGKLQAQKQISNISKEVKPRL